MLTVNGKKVKRSDYVTKDFKYGEFASKDGASTMKLDVKAVEKLQQLRDALGVPIVINSAYRSPNHNRAVGGASKSRHLYGDAFDIRIPGYTPLQIANYAKYLGFSGISAYNTFTHVDTRPGGFISWGKNKNRIKSVKPPVNKKPSKPKPAEFKYKSDTIKFDINGEVIETLGVRRYLANDRNFIQFIAVRDLECLGYNVEWKSGITYISQSNNKRKANLSMQYVLNNVSHALVKMEYKNKQVELEGHAIYDKYGNATQFIAVKDLKGLGYKVEWDSKRRLVVLK